MRKRRSAGSGAEQVPGAGAQRRQPVVGVDQPAVVEGAAPAPDAAGQAVPQGLQLGDAVAVARQPDNAYLRTWEVAGTSHIDDHEAGYEVTTELGEYPSSVSIIPRCSLGTPIEGTGTAFDGVDQADDMPLWQVEDAALADMQTWLHGGPAAPHEPSQMTVIPILGGLFDLVPTNQYGIASGGIQLPEAQVRTEYYSPINVYLSTDISLTPLALLADLGNLITLYSTGGTPITDTTGRDVGLCLLSGYFTNLSSSTLKALYPTDADYVAKYTAAVDSLVSEGFMTASDGTAAIANAEAGYGPVQGPPPETIP